jgi:ABC-2 type transport system ATP-binding protein
MPKERECVTASEDVVLSVDELRMRYGTTDVLHGVTFQVRRGEVVALLGPNGAGKTTTVEILEGFRMRSVGRVEVLGTDPARGSEQWRARVGIVLQSWRDHGRWRVRELLAHLGSYYACYSTELIERPWDADELVAAVGLANCAGKKVKTLSGGQRRRLDVALGLVGRPELLFLDEPTAGFDPQAGVSSTTCCSASPSRTGPRSCSPPMTWARRRRCTGSGSACARCCCQPAQPASRSVIPGGTCRPLEF